MWPSCQASSCVSWSQNGNSLIGGEFKYAIAEPAELARNFMNLSIVCFFFQFVSLWKETSPQATSTETLAVGRVRSKSPPGQRSRCNSEIPFQSPATFSTDVNITFKSLNRCRRIWSDADGPPTSPSDITRKRRRSPARQQANAAPKN